VEEATTLSKDAGARQISGEAATSMETENIDELETVDMHSPGPLSELQNGK